MLTASSKKDLRSSSKKYRSVIYGGAVTAVEMIAAVEQVVGAAAVEAAPVAEDEGGAVRGQTGRGGRGGRRGLSV